MILYTEYTSWSVPQHIFSRHAFTRTAGLEVKQNLCVVQSVPLPSLSAMFMLNVSLGHFPSLFSSPSAHLSRLSMSTILQLEEVGTIARARPLAGVSLAKWPIQPRTQATSPSLPTSSATWIRSTPMIFPDSHHDFRSSDDTAVIHTCAAGRPASTQPQQADQCSVASGNRMLITCRIVLAIRKLG